MTGWRAAGATLLVFGVAVAGLGACADKGTNRIPPAAALHVGPAPTGSTTTSTTAPAVAIGTPSSAQPVHGVGEQVTTAKGNVLVLKAYDRNPGTVTATAPPGGTLIAAEVQGCATSEASTVQPGLFSLELDNGVRQAAMDGGRQPPLVPTTVPPDQCALGWVTFGVPAGRTPRYLVFTSTNVIYWAV